MSGLNHVKIHGAGESLNKIIIAIHTCILQEAIRLLVEVVSKTNTGNKLDQNIIISKRAQRMPVGFICYLKIECLGLFNLPLDLMQSTHRDRRLQKCARVQ